MKDADKALMDGLALVTDLREDEWALVVSDVEKAGGVRECRGHARVEIERAVTKARTLVAKHPGHADQSVHGGGRKGGKSPSSSTASPAGGSGGSVSPEASEQVMRAEKILTDAKEGAKYHDVKSIRQEKEMMGKATKDEAIGRAHKHDQDFRTASQDSNAYASRASEIRAARTGDPKAEKMAEAYDADSRRLQTEAAISMKLASAWTYTAMDKGASESDLTRTWSF